MSLEREPVKLTCVNCKSQITSNVKKEMNMAKVVSASFSESLGTAAYLLVPIDSMRQFHPIRAQLHPYLSKLHRSDL